jgi:hypothetical protein
MFVELDAANDDMFYKFTMARQNASADTNADSPAAVVEMSDSAGTSG